MFNFTTQTIYNLIATTGANKNMWVASNSKKPSLRIGNTRFNAEDIIDIQVKNPTVENLASVTFDMSDVLIDTSVTGYPSEVTARIVLYVGLSMNAQDAFYANDFVYKGKPLTVEFGVKSTDTADVVANRVKKIADKYLLLVMGPERILSISTTTTSTQGSEAGTVTFTGVNGYQQIKKAVLQIFDPEAKTIDCCANQGDYVDVITGVPVTYTTDATGVATITSNKIDEDGNTVAIGSEEVAIAPGIEAFGDYNWIIHNLRLPTAANTGFWAPTKEEMPIPGQQYTQFIIKMGVERDGISGEIVGARAKSVTTHVLYVAGLKTTSGSAAKAVNDALTTLLGTDASTKMKTDADTALQTPFA